MPAAPRIAFISSLVFGGSTTFVCNLAGELTRREIQTIVVSPDNANTFAADFQRAGVKVVLHDDRRLIFEDRLQAMLKTLAAFQATVVVACLGPATYELLRYVPRGVHRMAVVQTDAPTFYDTVILYAGFMDAVVGVSSTVTKRLATIDAFRTVPKLCLPYGVPMPQKAEPRGRDGQPLRILYLGRIIDAQKRVNLFPEILSVLQQAGIPFQWTIAGEGDKQAYLQGVMKPSAPSQQIAFPGPVPNAQVPSLLEKHDIFLLASDAEGLPLSLLEAMGQGLVPVVSDLESGIREVVEETNGILVPISDVEGYARAIIHLHEHRDELAAKSAAAHARVRIDYSVEAMADRWLATFPQDPPTVGTWQTNWDIKPLLVARHPAYFSPPMRVLRRLAMRFRRFGKK